MNEIRFATKRDMAAIRAIWSAVFTADTAAQRNRFLKVVHVSDECMVACRNGKPVSMAFFLPASFCVNGQRYTARYLYAAATLPAYRGNGIFGDLLNAALSVFKERGVDFCFLNPAEQSLVDYYRRFGFEPALFCRSIEGIAQVAQLPLAHLSSAEYYALRRTLVPCDHVRWERRFLQYATTYATPLRVGERACVLFTKQDDTLRVIELLGVPSAQQHIVCSALAWHQECTHYEARVPSKVGECFGMVLPLAAEPLPSDIALYMGLAFD